MWSFFTEQSVMKLTGSLCVALALVWVCAVDQSGAIFGGQTVGDTSKLPWVVLVKDGRRMIGSGALIYNNLVLTSASCVYKKYRLNRDDLSFVLGENDITKEDGEQTLKAKRIFVHPAFNAKQKKNDLALVELSEKADMKRSNIGRIAASAKRALLEETTGCLVAGWGISEDENGNEYENTQLQMAAVVIKSDDICEAIRIFQPDDSVCYGTRSSKMCKKDTGAPLACKLYGRYRLLGIHTGPMKSDDVCAQEPFVGTTLTASYKKWIRHTRKGQDTGMISFYQATKFALDFRFFDINNDGRLSKEDDINVGDARMMWWIIIRGRSVQRHIVETSEVFVMAKAKLILTDLDKFTNDMEYSTFQMWTSFDTDNSGDISISEFRRFCNVFQLEKCDAYTTKKVFQDLGRTNRSLKTIKLMSRLWTAFYISADEGRLDPVYKGLSELMGESMI